jgi:DNA-binding MarR family transcriptional regulator
MIGGDSLVSNQGRPMFAPTPADYRLEDQIGFILRQASQRHAAIFADAMIADLTPTQFAALAKLGDTGPCSQNRLGRHTAMDAATIKGVIDRLCRRGLTETRQDEEDGRRLLVALTPEGREILARALPVAAAITEATLAPLDQQERAQLLGLLRKMT